LRRFWDSLPKSGHIAIFDRSWYGRVMVERIEGFCTEAQWKRAYDEINHFELSLHEWGAVIVKLWLQIDRDEQLVRFNNRQNNPEKKWKITDEDWRNREKWDLYETAANEMLRYTNTEYAPWAVIESNDKKYAPVKAINTVIAQIEKAGTEN
jgi:polyphosphate kinase 2 (PPK2 family)